MRLLYHVWNALGALEAYQYLISAGIDVSYFIYEVKDTEEREYSKEEHYNLITSELNKKSYDAVSSWNYYSVDAVVCHENHSPYIAWVYDCPLAAALS